MTTQDHGSEPASTADAWGEAMQRANRCRDLDAIVELLPRVPATDGPLHGLPFAVKEIIAVRGSVTSAGSDIAVATSPSTRDSPPVALLRAAGALPFARTRSHEHAWGITGRHPRNGGVVNPRDRSRVAGGSSGGSAALVAAGVVRFGLGTDTAGSIRIPAAFCGVVGVKPTWGSVALTDVHPMAESFDTAGVLARDVADAASVLRAWSIGTDSLGDPVVGVALDATLPELRPDLKAVTARALALLDAPVITVPPWSPMREVFTALQATEVLAVHRDQLGSWPLRRAEYGADVAERLAIADETPAADQGQLRSARARLAAVYLAAWEQVDVLALPMAATGPTTVADPGWVQVDWMGVGSRRVELRELVLPFTVPASLLGLPAMSLPIGQDRDGLPVGLQLLARPGQEAALLAAASRLETLLA